MILLPTQHEVTMSLVITSRRGGGTKVGIRVIETSALARSQPLRRRKRQSKRKSDCNSEKKSCCPCRNEFMLAHHCQTLYLPGSRTPCIIMPNYLTSNWKSVNTMTPRKTTPGIHVVLTCMVQCDTLSVNDKPFKYKIIAFIGSK